MAVYRTTLQPPHLLMLSIVQSFLIDGIVNDNGQSILNYHNMQKDTIK